MTEIKVVLAGGAYDRVIPLQNGQVRPAGIDLQYLAMPIEEVFWRALRHTEFDAAELSLGYYWWMRAHGDARYVAIPVFPSRFFRHGCAYVSAKSDLRDFSQLRGCTIGVPEYTMTACVWLRGLLQDEHGIAAEDIHWRVGGIESPGRRDRIDMPLPASVDIAPIPPDAALNGLLAEGKLDAVFCPRIPSAYWTGEIRRLLPDYQQAERAYYERTKIFPIMHVVAVRRELYNRHPWAAMSLFDAYQQAKSRTYQWLEDINALPVSLPWYVPAWEETRRLFGPDPWADGLGPNRHCLEVFGRYMTDQHLASPATLEDLFAPNTLDRYVI